MAGPHRRAALPVALAFAASALVAGCAEVPPLETPDEVEAIRAEWEAEAGLERDEVDAEEIALTEEEPEKDDYVIDVPPPYPSEVPAPPDARRNASEAPEGEEVAEEGPTADSSVVRIQGTSREQRPRSLYEASEAAKEKRKSAPRARIAITDDNLHEYQEGNITIGGSDGDAQGEADAEAEEAMAAAGERAREEEYWRSTVRDLRLRLRAAVDELAELEGRSSDLRRSFYAESDPYVRDGEIKPAWDRTLDRMEEARREILDLTRRLDTTLREGRRAGALPGWLREGADLEPTPDELPEDLRSEVQRTHEPGEPRVIEIEEREPPDGND
jgi:hypothetical protein